MFIVFEGIDGCGKSTQVFLLAEYLSSMNKYNHVLVTRNPYKDMNIRKLLVESDDAYSAKEKLTELFIKDREEHISELIIPSLKKGIIILLDRYKYSTIAYQAAQGQDAHMLIDRQKDFPVPDFVFIIDVQVKTAIERMKKDTRNEQKFEKNHKFLEETRRNYLGLKELLPQENIILINGEKNIEEIFEEVKQHMKI